MTYYLHKDVARVMEYQTNGILSKERRLKAPAILKEDAESRLFFADFPCIL
jgi:hypothetical protein